MKITVLCVGKIKEQFYRDALSEYLKRMSKYANVSVVEVADEKTPEQASDEMMRQIKDKEGKRILEKWDDSAYSFVLAINGKQFSSEDFAEKINELGVYGTSHIQFVIGGSLGLSDEVLKKANHLLSFSKMTFPHQLMRVVLMEQIYRAYRIIRNEPYHK